MTLRRALPSARFAERNANRVDSPLQCCTRLRPSRIPLRRASTADTSCTAVRALRPGFLRATVPADSYASYRRGFLRATQRDSWEHGQVHLPAYGYRLRVPASWQISVLHNGQRYQPTSICTHPIRSVAFKLGLYACRKVQLRHPCNSHRDRPSPAALTSNATSCSLVEASLPPPSRVVSLPLRCHARQGSHKQQRRATFHSHCATTRTRGRHAAVMRIVERTRCQWVVASVVIHSLTRAATFQSA